MIIPSDAEWCFAGYMVMEGAFSQKTMVIQLGIARRVGAEVSASVLA